MRMAHTIRLGTIGAFLLGSTATYSTGQPEPDSRTGSLPHEGVQPVYSPDPSDSWNRVFNALFARTVHLRLSKEFAGAALLERVRVLGFPDLPVSTSTFERIESGDLAIEPLDPVPVHAGSRSARQRVLFEPSFTQLKRALNLEFVDLIDAHTARRVFRGRICCPARGRRHELTG
jgi:hypothetical protein